MTTIIIKIVISLIILIGSWKGFTNFIFSRGTIMTPKAVILLASIISVILTIIFYFIWILI